MANLARRFPPSGVAVTRGLGNRLRRVGRTEPRGGAAPQGGDIAWHTIGPGGGGWIQSIACDPASSQILHVGCDVGGYYFSADGGRTYQVRNQGLRDYFIQSIAVHPRRHEVIILGTQSGIHRSTDQGRSWQWIRTGFPPLAAYNFCAHWGRLVRSAAAGDRPGRRGTAAIR